MTAHGRPACGSCARLTAAALDLAEWARAVRPALGATSRLEMEARVAAVHDAVVADADEPDEHGPAAADERGFDAREEFAKDTDEPGLGCPRCASAACDGGCALPVAALDYCEVCEEVVAEWSLDLADGLGSFRACSACVECHAADRMEPGVTWTRLDGGARQTDGLIVLVNVADTARKEG